MAKNNKCLALDCDKQTGEDMLFCRDHWFALPQDLRTRIWQHYREECRGVIGAEGEHRADVREAIRFHIKKEKKDVA